MKKKLILGLIAAVSLTLGACSSNEKNDNQNEQTAWEGIQESGILKVATSGTLYPNSFHEKDTDKLTGYEVEIIREVANRLDLEIEFTEMGVDGMLTSVNSGAIDVAAMGIDRDGEDADKYNYTIPYKYSYGAMVVRKSDDSGIKTLEDLKGKKAAGAATTSYMKVARHFGSEEVIYDNATNDQYLSDVANGRTDVILNDYYSQKLAVAALPEIQVKVHDIFYNPSETNYSMKKGNDELTEKVNAMLEEMISDGTLSELSKEFYAGEDVTKQIDYDFPEIEFKE
ncbi:amino acid ABC transporter substrate-binding protein, PAAT family [Carnobacterium iners]|uniref:Amino acid ABC transporter substrate-binding protein, PAAT family n=1 Tax=Carnobacterium iners TaxID=1073423 RepID=A0A1X7N1Z5_9LACT|nr:transporter substrate-binding domain-containing protein [Carnobacterium iners]SEK97002.1 amino acid ABC transporter substrate-binding protein, PAAT family [Carnobacterium iners]SMH31349.1 amino acid ABC transporter substrate-binding protein, PAAT family [Carnobacterium iners]